MFNMATTSVQAGYTYTFRINLAFGPGITFRCEVTPETIRVVREKTALGGVIPPSAFLLIVVEAFVSNGCLVLTATSTATEGDSEISVSAVIAV